METKGPFYLPHIKENNESSPLTLYFNEYINERKFASHLCVETIKGYTDTFKLFSKVMPEITDTDLLTPPMLVEFFKRIETRQRIVGKNTIKTGVKNSTIKTQWSKLNTFFVWLEQKGRIVNPLKNIKPPHPIYDDPRALTDSEIHRIYSAIALRSINTLLLRRDLMMVSLLLYCGLRRNELISLRVHDIDIEKREITIRSETSKSKRTRILKLHPALVLHIRDYYKERKARNLTTEYLIIANRNDARLTREGLKHWVVALNKKSGVRFYLHKFRHTFACKLAEADVHPFKIQKLLGHTNILMTMKYVRSMRTENMGYDICKISI